MTSLYFPTAVESLLESHPPTVKITKLLETEGFSETTHTGAFGSLCFAICLFDIWTSAKRAAFDSKIFQLKN